jgi:ABC-type oligopeptide transport system ATPase subunit
MISCATKAFMEPLIVCENLVKIYRLNQEGGASVEVQALQGLDITVADGEMIGIVGAAQHPRRA